MNRAGLNDTVHAEISVCPARSGRSKRIMAQKLAIKGIDRETAVMALEESDDLVAAINFVRKRAFSPFRARGKPTTSDTTRNVRLRPQRLRFRIGTFCSPHEPR